jgi:PAS domain S-box-containing protein
MEVAPLPHDEQDRLKALMDLGVLDTPSEKEFDALVEAAALVCDVPISLVSLIDTDRQWFKANHGLPGATQTSRDVAFCSHAILGEDVFEVADASLDPRFADNPLVVADPNIRFYAGVPLKLSAGQQVGTLCVIDRTPKRLSHKQKEVLSRLAIAAVKALESRRTAQLFAQSEARFRALVDSSPLGVFATDAVGACTYTNARWQEIFGLAAQEGLGDGWARSVHPDDRERVHTEWRDSAARGDECSMAFRVVRPDGQIRFVSARSRPATSPEGVVEHVGSIEDVTSQRVATMESDALLDTMRSQFIMKVTDAAGTVLEANDAYCAISQFSREELVGDSQHLRKSGLQESGFFDGMWRTISSGHSWHGEMCNRAKDGSLYWMDSVIAPILGADGTVRRHVFIARDITARVRQQRVIEEANVRLALATDSGEIGVWDFDVAANRLTWDDWMYRLYGADSKSPDLPTCYQLWAKHLHPDDREAAESAFAAAIASDPETGMDFRTEFRIIWPDGSTRYLLASGRLERNELGKVIRIVGVNWDVTAQRQMAADLEQQHELLRVTFRSIGDAVITTDAVQCVTWLNPVAEQMTGWSEQQAQGQPLSDVYRIVSERTQLPLVNPVATCLQSEQTVALNDHAVLISKHGQPCSIEESAAPIRDERGSILGAVLVFHDVSRQRQQQLQVESALSEKELLLKEVYHRVKNNLQVVQSLLNLQRRTLPEGAGREALEESVQRVRAMALVHERLYRSGNLAALSLKGYCDDLLLQVSDASGARARGIAIRTEVNDFEVGLDEAIPFGLLLTELVTNSLKHGFPPGRSGEIVVRLHEATTPQDGCTLTVADNGCGVPEGQDPFVGSSMGLQLAASLAGQLGGKLTFEHGAGAIFVTALPRLCV